MVDLLRIRWDAHGSLVALADGRYAVTGPVVAVGAGQTIQRYARDRLRRTDAETEQAWWQDVIGGLAR